MVANALLDPSFLADHQVEAYGSFARLSAVQLQPEREQGLDPRSVLLQSAWFLEFVLLSSCLVEAAAEHGCEDTVDPASLAPRTWLLGEALSGLRVADVVAETVALFGPMPSTSGVGPRLKLANALRFFRSAAQAVVSSCPITELEGLADEVQLAEQGYRCRRAYDGLAAFHRRSVGPRDHRLVVAGQAYAEGRIRLQEVAALLELPPEDAVALLERDGYARSPGVILLSADQRAAKLAEIRRERLARGSQPHVSDALMRRDVIATQRIEGIDARPWLATRRG